MKRQLVIILWVLIVLFLLYAYFLNPELFRHIFQYPGPGSPFINPPDG
jgi:hypothetical protein